MGKSCIRFKKMEDMPYELIGELAAKMTVSDWMIESKGSGHTLGTRKTSANGSMIYLAHGVTFGCV